MVEIEIMVEKLVGESNQEVAEAIERAGVKKLDTFPLYNFLSYLGPKYIAGIIVLAITFSITVELLGSSGQFSPRMTILNFFAFNAMLLLVAFIVYIIYRISVGDYFNFLPLMISASTLFFLASLTVIACTVLSDGSGFRILQVLLAIIASLAIAAIFSAFVIIARRFISA